MTVFALSLNYIIRCIAHMCASPLALWSTHSSDNRAPCEKSAVLQAMRWCQTMPSRVEKLIPRWLRIGTRRPGPARWCCGVLGIIVLGNCATKVEHNTILCSWVNFRRVQLGEKSDLGAKWILANSVDDFFYLLWCPRSLTNVNGFKIKEHIEKQVQYIYQY